MTAKRLSAALPAGTVNIFVISCGFGALTVSELAGPRVYAACDSVSFGGLHGMMLTKHLCDACGQCYLNLTGGICPIVDCSKGLVNGQCGGSKNKKCEVGRNKDCAWVRIYERLNTQYHVGQADNPQAGNPQAGYTKTDILPTDIPPVRFRDYSRVSFRLIDEYVRTIREKRFEGFYGGLHLYQRKELSEHLPLERFPAPGIVVIPMSQHTGVPATPTVKAGDAVRLGQKVGEAGAVVSSPVHASVSGTVIAVEPRLHPVSGIMAMSVVIESDGKDELHPSVQPCEDWGKLLPGEIVALIRDKGIVGMGGAAFPTAVKMDPAKPVDTIIINGCECEPLLTADHRVMLEYAGDVILGLEILLRATGAEKGIIAVEDNKHDAITLLEAESADKAGISVAAVRTKYPHGAEKMLINHILGRRVPEGGLPFDVGAIVSNVSTAKAVSDTVTKGMPLIERVVTVSGERIRRPGNYMVRVGTPVREILEYCGGITGDGAIVKLGGPMMGVGIEDTDVPVIKGINGIIAIKPAISESLPCIRCGHCADVCPMELYPLNYPHCADIADWNGMRENSVSACIECGCCDYICPSGIPIRDAVKLGKRNL